ncbi:MAG: glycosyltransferase family 4 protein [Prevotella sp.]|nr:glycosyltransferase family 4 protein [Prevotella sp.]
MKKVVILGHFAFGKDKANGQTIKTKIVGDWVKRELGEQHVDFHDTMGGWKFVLSLPVVAFRLLSSYRNIIFLPAYKGVRVILPIFVLFNSFFKRKLHYVVIGGWLPGYVDKYPILRRTLHKIDRVYVETESLMGQLKSRGYDNIKRMPNFKPLHIVAEQQLAETVGPPFRLCTFSRVMREKGIEDAIEAVKACNERLGRELFSLDIYGLIQKGEEDWFGQLMKGQPQTVKYCGIVPPLNSTETLKDYFLLLFPTRFKTEGFAGTLIDAMSAGLPSIASDCTSNKELIDEGETGLLFHSGNVAELTDKLLQCAANPAMVNSMRPYCVRKAKQYLPEDVIKILTMELD